MSEGGVTLWGAHTGAVSWQDLWPHGKRTPHWSRFAARACDPPGGPTLKQSVPEGLQPMGRTHIGEDGEGLSPVGGTPFWSRGRV